MDRYPRLYTIPLEDGQDPRSCGHQGRFLERIPGKIKGTIGKIPVSFRTAAIKAPEPAVMATTRS